jgi:DNA-binding PadR family transcriptional regulator
MDSNKKFLNGTLNTIVLALLKENGKMYGYEICQKAKTKTDSHILLTEGAIYPTLHRLEKEGLIISSKEQVNGRTRKYYSINVSSLPQVDYQIHLLSQFTGHLRTLLNLST